MFKLDYMGCDYHESVNSIIDRPHGSQNYLFIIFRSTIYIQINETKHLYPAGTCILYEPDFPQLYCQPETGFINDWIHFSDTTNGCFVSSLGFPVNTPFQVNDVNGLYQHLLQIEREELMQHHNSQGMIHLLIQELFIHITRSLSRDDQKGPVHKSEALFRKTRSIILSQLENPWTVDDMANLTGLSRSRFTHIYTSIFHLGPKEDLIQQRMQLARYLLRTQTYTISEIAYRVGYDNVYHFSKQFKRNTGYSPTTFRKIHTTNESS